MARQDPQITSFNGGELSPYMLGRPDTERYRDGCEHLLNFIPTVTGGLRRRPGTYAVDTVGMNVHGLLIPFTANADTRAEFVVNVTTLGSYFFHAPTRSRINLSGTAWIPGAFGGSTPAALNTPWDVVINSNTSECYLQWAQSNDVMWITHPRFMPVKLKRIGTYEFSWAYMGDGYNVPVPFNDINPLNTVTITASAESGVGITLTASAGVFTTDFVNGYFRLEQSAVDGVKQWEAGKAVTTPATRRSNGRNYTLVANATTGTIRPTHSEGAKFDGDTGAQWAFHDEGYGVVAITGYTSPTQVTATVVRTLPASVVSSGTTRWAQQAWSLAQGYPSSVCFFRERLCFGRDQTLWCSVAGDFENFTATEGGQVTDDLAITATIAANANDRIQWLHPMSQLVAGTKSSLFAIGELSTADPFGPANIRAVPFGGCGADKVPPIRIGETSLFVERGGASVREIAYSFEADSFVTNDLTVDADHITGQQRFTGMTYARRPDNVIWFTLTGGKLVGLTYNKAQNVRAWHPHQLGGYGYDGVTPAAAGWVAAVMGPDGKTDDVWILGNRPSITALVGSVEVLGANVDLDFTSTYYYHAWPQTQDAAYLDYYREVSIGAGATDIPTVAWIYPVGRTVQGLIAGCVQPPAATTISGYTIASSQAARKGRVGYAFKSYVQPMPLIGGSATGSPHGKLQGQRGVVVRLYQSGGFRYGKTWTDATLDRKEFRKSGMPMDTAVPLQTGDVYVDLPSGWNDRATIYIEQDQPLPLNLLALFPKLTVEDSR